MAITKRRFQAAQAVVQIDDSFNPPDWYPDEHPPMPEIVARFFELAPDAQGLFRGDMERQYLKLMNMIAAIVATLDKREMFKSIISHSGRQHAQFGAKPMHFAAFGDALIWGLEQ
jgi:hemoglobin-like flavoprotein